MKRGGWLKRGTKRLERKTRLEARGGSRFPARRHPKFMAWMLEKCRERRPCDGCGKWCWLERAHLVAKGSGGNDCGNVSLLCAPCHTSQEKRTDAWIAETGVDLYARAREYAEEFLVSRKEPTPVPTDVVKPLPPPAPPRRSAEQEAFIIKEITQILDRRLAAIREELLPQLVAECMEKLNAAKA